MAVPDPLSFPEWLRRRRKALDLTQDELGRLAGCSGALIRKIEAGERKPSRQLAELLARALQVPENEREAFLQMARGTSVTASLAGPASALPAPGRVHPPDNLPAPLTSLIDCRRDAAAVAALLSAPDMRWVTLVGPPGIGKTRLSLQVGRQLQPAFRDGVWFVDLAPLDDPASVMPAIAHALQAFDLPATADLSHWIHQLQSRSLLLILDNLEHLIPAAADVAALLKSCPGLKVLVTSRVPAQVYGEQEYAVPPLSVPPPGDDGEKPETLLEYEAVQLFVARVRLHQPGFSITRDNARRVAQICAALEGIPLALELAAARLHNTALSELADLLSGLQGDGWVSQLGTPARDLPARQRTLENVIQWSYNLLTAEQRSLFCALGMFAGWFDLEAVRALSPGADLALLHSLEDQSLLVRGGSESEPRWRMLEIIRDFARLKLGPDGLARLGREHARYFLSLAESVPLEQQPERRDQFFAEAGADLHTALHRLIAAGDAEGALRLTNVLLPFWEVLGFLREGLDMAGRTLAMPGPSDPELRIAVAQQAANLAWQQHDFAAATALMQAASEFARAQGRVGNIPMQLNQLGRVMIEQGRYAEARAALDECLQLLRDSPSAPQAAMARVQLGEIALFEGRSADSRAILERAIGSLHEQDFIFLAMAYSDLAEIAMLAGDYAGARERLLQALPHARLHIRRAVYTLSSVGGWLALEPGGKTARRIEAARLFGAVQNLTDRSRIVLVPYYRRLNEERILLLSRLLRASSWQHAFDEGRAWGLEQAIQHARDYLEAAGLANYKS